MEELRLGSTGPDVWLLQSALNKRFPEAGVLMNGRFDRSFAKQLAGLQGMLGLPGSGEVRAADWRALMPVLLGTTTHFAETGDTHYALCRQYGLAPTLLSHANPKTDLDALRVGRRVTVPQRHPVVHTDVPYSYQTLQLDLLGLRARYPFCRVDSIGRSVLGRNLFRVRIGQGKHTVGYNGAHHANEWITAPLLMVFIETLCHAFSIGEPVAGHDCTDILKHHTFEIVPMANPDGVDLCTGAIKPDSGFYKFAQNACLKADLPFPDGWKANARGVDLNLNYPARWEQARQIKAALGYKLPGPRDFPGPAPLSEPESAAMAVMTRRACYELTLAYHTQGRVIYTPSEEVAPPLTDITAQYFACLSGYDVETPPPESDNAGYKDWFVTAFKKRGFTLEAGLGQSPLPLEQLPQIVDNNMPVLLLGAYV